MIRIIKVISALLKSDMQMWLLRGKQIGEVARLGFQRREVFGGQNRATVREKIQTIGQSS
jgi:hypothetical protein